MSPRYVIADGLGIAAWIDGEYWTADWSKAQQFASRLDAEIWAEWYGLEDYTIQPLPACQEKASA